MTKPNALPALDDVLRVLSYDPETGFFYRIAGACGPNSLVGDIAGRVNDRGYRVISVKNKRYRAHRLAWLVHYGCEPNGFIDHINQDKDDNSIKNLRIATKSQNMRNRPAQRNNKLGVKGVHFDEKGNRYIAQIRSAKGVSRYLGSFQTLELAAKAYASACKAEHGEFASGV